MREPFSPPTNTLDPAELFTDIHLYFFLHHHSSAITFRVQITGASLAWLHKRPFPAGNHPPTLWACVYWLLIFHFPHTNTHSHSSNFPTGKRTLFFRPPQQLLITTINWCFSHPCPPRQTCQLNIFVVVVFPPWWTCTFTEIQLIYILFNFFCGVARSRYPMRNALINPIIRWFIFSFFLFSPGINFTQIRLHDPWAVECVKPPHSFFTAKQFRRFSTLLLVLPHSFCGLLDRK